MERARLVDLDPDSMAHWGLLLVAPDASTAALYHTMAGQTDLSKEVQESSSYL